MKNKVLIFLAFLLFILIIFTTYLNITNKRSIQTSNISNPINNFPSNTTKDYSNIRYLTPGKSTLLDIKKINGEPLRTKIIGNEEYLYYRAPFGNLNPVLIKNNILVYASEYVFGSYRGKYSDFINAYGDPDKVFYDNYGFSWSVFYKRGLAVQRSSNEIARIIYFVPNNITLFYETVVKDFELSENPKGLM